MLNQFGFKQWLSANKIQHNCPRILIYEIGLIFFVQVKDVIYDLSPGLDAHSLNALVVLIAV